ncbi:MAG: hypothetical protein RLZZ453_733 [Chlamydiota bacterium]|jgi:tRNA G18 (ribose-2'-O)-methylase SpoU
MISGWTEGEFLKLSERFQHKICAQLLHKFHTDALPHDLVLYRKTESWLNLPPLDISSFPLLADRYHYHLKKAHLDLKEYNLLTDPIHKVDTPSSTPYLPLCIYLDKLRSAFNVGSILRTTEAFRLGSLYFSPETPFIDNPKVQKTSMWTYDKVPAFQQPCNTLPRPWIALETVPSAPSLFTFCFPPVFTLFLGNEEYGLSKERIDECDATVQIPLYGFKNSLNVASAYAIAAAVISDQLRKAAIQERA